jgi:hypothetical protein
LNCNPLTDAERWSQFPLRLHRSSRLPTCACPGGAGVIGEARRVLEVGLGHAEHAVIGRATGCVRGCPAAPPAPAEDPAAACCPSSFRCRPAGWRLRSLPASRRPQFRSPSRMGSSRQGRSRCRPRRSRSSPLRRRRAAGLPRGGHPALPLPLDRFERNGDVLFADAEEAPTPTTTACGMPCWSRMRSFTSPMLSLLAPMMSTPTSFEARI